MNWRSTSAPKRPLLLPAALLLSLCCCFFCFPLLSQLYIFTTSPPFCTYYDVDALRPANGRTEWVVWRDEVVRHLVSDHKQYTYMD